MLTQPQEWMTITQSPQSQISTQDADHGARPKSACNANLGPDGSRESPPDPSHAPEATRVSNVNESGFMERSSYIAPDRFQAEDGSEIYYATQSSSEVTSKILDLHKALELPPRAVRDGLFANFWAYCYPWDPIIEKSQVIGVSLEKLSPLLLQAIFLAGSRMSSASASYATPQEFYKRAKTLFYLNTEQDPLTLLTAVSLLHWSNPHGPERVSTDTSSFWCRVAVSLAQQMGLHSQKKRVHNESLRRRIWWSLVARDCLISLAHGRPLAINLDDCDVVRLTPEDFPNSTPTGLIFIAVPSKLHITDIEDSLYQWVKSLPEPVRLPQHILNDKLGQVPKPYNFECRQVHVLFLISLILLYRPRTVEGPFPTAAVIASSTVAGIFEEFLARDEVRLLGPVFTFYLLAAAIALLSCYKFLEFWAIAQEDLKVIGHAQEELLKKWPSALGSIRTFEKMHKLAVTTQMKANGSPEIRLTKEQATLFEDIDCSLCRMWDVLQTAGIMTRNPGSWLTCENMISRQAAIGTAPPLNNGLPIKPAVNLFQGDAAVGQVSFDEVLHDENPQLSQAVGDWLCWDEMSLNFS